MRFTVTSLPAAQNTLAAIWMTATDRNAVTRAANTIDAILKKNHSREAKLEAPTFPSLSNL